jgi:HTH-type transcriptional regulator/antitoxin HigA
MISVVDQERYGQLLAEYRPGVIESPEEHERLLGLAEQLLDKAGDDGEGLDPEQRKLLTLLVLLVELYEAGLESDEDEAEPPQPPQPHETLRRLLDARSLEAGDVVDIFGNPRLTHEVLEGKRPITRGQAKQLGQFFQVPARLFHD